SDSEDDQPASEGKDTTAATAPMKKKTDKDKVEVTVKEKEKRKRTVVESERVTKKPRTQKKKEPKVVRKLM
ncbi:hypothetical protein A2U01_0110162, partial [Trifolium medium]|nr:hypothetical protein [Trifolium medium]